MSGFDAVMVAECVRMLEGVNLSVQQAEALARVVGWRDEFLANLALRRGSFRHHQRLERSLSRVAKAGSAVQSTRRKEHADANGRRQANEKLYAALGRLIEDAVKDSELHADASEAMKIYIKQGSAEPGSHSLMIPPPFEVQK